ncbi:CaiB/BaiF CoA transferase family protein [Piscinibacter sakaiensis]|uniref:CaiB/BaiF CoA transferase family protein n=1 Tax=Piscinibacter sakaiensis TaxID=1547922 RepID=UPI003AAB657B
MTQTDTRKQGPLAGLKVVEMAGLGPGPFCAMMLADMGAEVLRITRPPTGAPAIVDGSYDVLNRGRPALALDLRQPQAVETVLDLVGVADVLVEGFRPGVMERMGLGPDTCLERNPRLVYGRMTGWGQFGPLSLAAGHDINYIALSGMLHAIGPADAAPTPPLNLVGDFGGGAMMLAFGVMCALHEARQSGKGQVIDAAMTDGAALLGAMMYGMKAAGKWSNRRGDNLLDGGAPFYATYACADGKHVAIGPLEPQFYAQLRRLCDLQDDPLLDARDDPARWPELRERLSDLFRTRSRDEWCALLEGSDACFAPVLDWDEAPAHPHNQARGSFVTVDGVLQPAPAPRFSRTPAGVPGAAGSQPSAANLLASWGIAADRIAGLDTGS